LFGSLVKSGFDVKRYVDPFGDHEPACLQRHVSPGADAEVVALQIGGGGNAQPRFTPVVLDHSVEDQTERDVLSLDPPIGDQVEY